MCKDKFAVDDMGVPYSRAIYEQIIGRMVLDYVDKFKPYELSPVADTEALRVLSKIKDVLDSDDLGDPECFYRIDKIISELDETGLYTHRHDW